MSIPAKYVEADGSLRDATPDDMLREAARLFVRNMLVAMAEGHPRFDGVTPPPQVVEDYADIVFRELTACLIPAFDKAVHVPGLLREAEGP